MSNPYSSTSADNIDHNRRMHFAFVLDTTYSMDESFDGTGVTLRDHMNKLVRDMLLELVTNNKFAPYAYVSFVTFADGVTMETDFIRPTQFQKENFVCVDTGKGVQRVRLEPERVNVANGKTITMNIPVFYSIGESTYSRIGSGVHRAIEKLNAAKEWIRARNKNAHFYAPVMVLITDGAPRFIDADGKMKNTAFSREESDAMSEVHDHCRSVGNAENLIFPVICGIGAEAEQTNLKNYSQGYTDGWVLVDPHSPKPGFVRLFETIRVSITKSIALNDQRWREGKFASQQTTAVSGKHEPYRKPPVFTLDELFY